MHLDLYRAFLAICETGSFTRAANDTGLTQSAISQQIRRLEETLGRPLFTRTSGSVQLTEYGKSLLGFARDIVETHAEVLATFGRGSFSGLVVLGIPDGYVQRVMREVLCEFTELYPDATINVVIDDSPGLARRIAEGSVDLAFLTEGEWRMNGEIAFRDRIVIAGPAVGNLHNAEVLPLAVWDERAFDHRMMIEALDAMGRSHRIACICRSVHGKHAAITSGLCASVMVESSLIEGERAWLPEDGFPVLAEVSVRLVRPYGKKSRILDHLERHLLEHFSGKAPADITPPVLAPAVPQLGSPTGH